MKVLLVSLGIGLGILLSSLMAILVFEFKVNRDLRAENRKLLTEAQQASAKMEALAAEKTEATEKLSAKEKEADALQNKPVNAEAANDAKASSTSPRAQQVKAYLGREYLGMAWLVPTKISKDPETGVVTSEPVVVMSESLKKTFTEVRTSVVDREVPVNSSVNYNYYPNPNYGYPYYWYYGWGATTNGGGITNYVPPSPGKGNSSQSSTVRVQGGGKPWSPVTVSYGTPVLKTTPAPVPRNMGANVIGARQQVVGISAGKIQTPTPRSQSNF